MPALICLPFSHYRVQEERYIPAARSKYVTDHSIEFTIVQDVNDGPNDKYLIQYRLSGTNVRKLQCLVPLNVVFFLS